MTSFLGPQSRRTLAFVLTLGFVVHATAGEQATASADIAQKTAAPSPVDNATVPRQRPAPPKTSPRTVAVPALPQPAAEMREAILTAVRAGDIDELEVPLQWNEMKPESGADQGVDPITYWKRISADGQGRDILAALGNILDMRYAVEPLGKDFENNRIFVWPYLAAADLDKLNPAELVDLYRLMPPAEARAMRERKKWTWWKLTIGADGTWHTFIKEK
jgi:hypothetical protein